MNKVTFPRSKVYIGILLPILIVSGLLVRSAKSQPDDDDRDNSSALQNAAKLVRQGQNTFRFDTFGDQAFWGDMLKLHQAIAGSGLGGAGSGLSPANAIKLGLKVDIDALRGNLREQLL